MEKISIILPCYNEEENIELFYKECLSSFKNFKYGIELIFVNDGSKDNTFKEVLLFFSGRLSTLCVEVLILWFFITLFGLNSDVYVIIWTLLLQIIIFIGILFLSYFVSLYIYDILD